MIMSLENVSGIEEQLVRVCEHCPHAVDDAIDLQRGWHGQCAPGHCARAFFKLVAAAGERLPVEVDEIGKRLSQRLAVEATGSDGQILERLDFEPGGEKELEDYCQRVIGVFWMDRNYAEDLLKLRFCYR